MSSREKILIVEDDNRVREMLQDTMRFYEYETFEAMDGEEAIEKVKTLCPDLILLDVIMPRLDGIETTKILKEDPETQSIPIIMLTARVGEHNVVKGLEAGADDYITKPFQLLELVARVKAHLRAKKLHDQLLEESRERERLNVALQKAEYKEKEMRIKVKYTKELEKTNIKLEATIKELEKSKRELFEANTELEELSKLRSELFQNISHELKTPLTPLKGYLKLFLNGETGELNPFQEECIKAMKQSVDRFHVLVEDIIEMVKLESGRFTLIMGDVDLHEVFAESLSPLSLIAQEKGIKIITSVAENLPKIKGDGYRLTHIFSNLIQNALKFTPKEGEVIVEARASTQYKNHVEITITDNGIGIPQLSLKKIFEPFYQVDSSLAKSYGGTGLGLAIVKKFTEAHGGKIDVASGEGKGTTFSLFLPCNL
ncbi:MAG: ATP-binding protein [Thermodesulfobacteriota bacterium]|nr:ATP-binding protein [Thermodesulfobacteriota bacterium]